MRTIYHAEHQNDFHAGYEAKSLEIKEMGWEAARDKFNLDNPADYVYGSLAGYYYASGEIEALVDFK
jgi:hypothetical protein